MPNSDPTLVFHICQRDHPSEGGAYRVAQALVAEQLKRGLDSRLLFLYGQKGPSAESGITCHYLGAEQGKVGVHTMLGLSQFIKETKPSIIHCHDGLLWPRIALWGSRNISIHHCHLDAARGNDMKYRLNRWMTIQANARFIAISAQVKESWSSAGVQDELIDLIPNGVDCDRFRPAEQGQARSLARQLFPNMPSDNRLLLWLGRVEAPTKGADRLKRLIPKLPPGISLAIVGDGPARQSLIREFSTQLQMGTLLMPGAVDDPLPWYQAADAFLFTSHYEAYGLVLLEAASCRLPIISYPVGRGGAIRLLDELMANKLTDDDMELAASSIKFILDKGAGISEAEVAAAIRTEYAWSVRNVLVEQTYKSVLQRL